MFMFRSKRTNLIRQLLVKARKRRGAGHHHHEPRRGADDEPLRDMLKKLQDNQLEMLLTAVETSGQNISNCVLLSRDFNPHVLCCQTWRWPDLPHGSELRRMPVCRSASDPVYICCNPYHWSRLCRRESPPPPYSRCAIDDSFKPEDRAPSEVALVCRDTFPGSLTTNGEDSSSMNSRDWCKLAYWELKRRVGDLHPVEGQFVHVFGDIACGDGLNLQDLASDDGYPPEDRFGSASPESVCRTRRKIGLGVTLSREEDGIWLYNRSDHPVFVNSLTLEDPYSLPAPTKVPAKHCLCVFDPAKAAIQSFSSWSGFSERGPIDKNSVQISFAKGWGYGYKRQEITSCPCWIEILLAPCR